VVRRHSVVPRLIGHKHTGQFSDLKTRSGEWGESPTLRGENVRHLPPPLTTAPSPTAASVPNSNPNLIYKPLPHLILILLNINPAAVTFCLQRYKCNAEMVFSGQINNIIKSLFIRCTDCMHAAMLLEIIMVRGWCIIIVYMVFA